MYAKPRKFITSIQGPRMSGKTTALVRRAVDLALDDVGEKILIVAPNAVTAQHTFEKVLDYLPTKNIRRIVRSSEIGLTNGGSIIFKPAGLSSVGYIKSFGPDHIMIDEIEQMPDNIQDLLDEAQESYTVKTITETRLVEDNEQFGVLG